MTQVPPQAPVTGSGGPGAQLKPHRGVAVLVLGIVGLVLCFICGIIAWVMAKADLREMEAGQMDPSGMGMTKAGKICGMIGVIWQIIILGIQLLGVCAVIVGGAASG